MRLVVQRVKFAKVEVGGAAVGSIDAGLVALVCAMKDDDDRRMPQIAKKLVNLRIFRDESGRMNKSVLDIGGSCLLVSQFTLAADVSKGNRPGFSMAAPPDKAKDLFEKLVECVRASDPHVQTGVFGAEMELTLVNDGPVTIWIDI